MLTGDRGTAFMKARQGRRLRAAALVVVALASVGFTGCIQNPPMTVTPVVTGLDHVWDIGFLPDGTMLYTERAGRISAFVGGQKRLLVAPIDVVRQGEAGLMGMAIDPQFASNRFIYVCMASIQPNPGNDVRMMRLQVNANYTAATDRIDIVTGAPVNVSTAELGRHSGCRPRFGPDGRLYVGTGDAAVGTAPQDLRSLGGKVLRIDRNGNGVPANPGGFHDPRIWSTGHRNVQGIAFRASDGLGVSTEHGPDRDDEINRLSTGNFGWAPRYPDGAPGYYEGVPMTDRNKFPNAVGVLARSEALPTYAPSGATFVSGSRWGPWNGVLVVATLRGQSLRTFRFSSSGALEDVGIALTDQGRLRAVTQGPDNNLYVSTSNGGNGDKMPAVDPAVGLSHAGSTQAARMSTRAPANGTPSASSRRRWRSPLDREPSARTIRCQGTDGSWQAASTAPA